MLRGGGIQNGSVALRLAGEPRTDIAGEEALRRARAALEVALANQHAAAWAEQDNDARTLAALRPRQLLAQAVSERLQGGRAAILTTNDRDDLVAQARRLGLRAFDAHLVIAIVQDAARRGEPAWLALKEEPRCPRGDKLFDNHEATQEPATRGSLAGSVFVAVMLGIMGLASLIVLVGP